MEYKDRLKAARKHANLTQGELAEKVGITQTSISDLERGKSSSSSFNASIAKTCGVNALWLENGSGHMLPTPLEEAISVTSLGGFDPAGASPVSGSAEGKHQTTLSSTKGAADKVLAMLSKHKGLSATARDQIAQAVEQTVSEAIQSSNVISADFSGSRLKPGELLIPQYDVRGSMGHGQVPADYTDFMRNVVVSAPQLEKLGLDYTSPANLAIISGWGQSMAPTIQDKDPVIVDRGVTDFIGDGVYVITWDGMLYIKRLQSAGDGKLELISDNPKHKDRVVNTDEVAIHARVLLVWNAQKL